MSMCYFSVCRAALIDAGGSGRQQAVRAGGVLTNPPQNPIGVLRARRYRSRYALFLYRSIRVPLCAHAPSGSGMVAAARGPRPLLIAIYSTHLYGIIHQNTFIFSCNNDNINIQF